MGWFDLMRGVASAGGGTPTLPLDYDTYGFDQTNLVFDFNPMLGLASSGGLVDSWTDQKSGLVVSNTGSTRPDLISGAVNGKAAISGNGSNKVLNGLLGSNKTVKHIFIITKSNFTTGTFADYQGLFSPNDLTGTPVIVSGSSGTTNLETFNLDTLAVDRVNTNSFLPLGKWRIVAGTSIASSGATRDGWSILSDRNFGARFYNGQIMRVLTFSDMSSDNLLKVYHYLSRQMGKTILYFDGNSIVYGQGVTTPFPITTVANLGYEGYLQFNFGVSGQTTAMMQSDVSTQILNFFTDYQKSIYIPFEITNDLALGGTATDAYNRYVTLCQTAKAKGFKVVACTVLPRSDGGGSFETNRQTVNTNIRTNWATFSDGLADFGADTTIGVVGADSNTTYYQDGVHPTQAGHNILASILYPVISGISF
ncbi:SGNH/GDSL hydrolase family protein [Cytophagaceae bacterium DM2B3-1]|uniref:SGNH/GDSL hydrolase family protein n=1 Tax=Xanthocytophaga flava TaxID=3048013 RepID=A0ABT7CK80_9BACT|nr:SGNH/GDSL hydrolase family protein [Xanthocytophaga flavus]MDJ1494144.1 SGNH/GDSL hydrolase family protein [Xanthocytophaga flavus]